MCGQVDIYTSRSKTKGISGAFAFPGMINEYIIVDSEAFNKIILI